MRIVVACPCGTKLKAPEGAAGKRIKCPKCGTGVTVPEPEPVPADEVVDLETPPAPPAPTEPHLPAGWSVFWGEGFRVGVPDAVQFRRHDRIADTGRVVAAWQNGATVPDLPAYSVIPNPFPPEALAGPPPDADALYRAMADGFLRGGRAQMDTLTKVPFLGREGRQLTLRVGNLHGVVRLIVTDDASWTVGVIGAGIADDTHPLVKPFFDTFRVL